MSEKSKTRTTVDIYGQQYSIVGSENTSHVLKVASIVDEKMREIGRKNPYLDVHKLAVLTAVNVVHDYVKLTEKYEKLEQQVNKEKD
ncbi:MULTISPECIES: cell division protein ZapA [Bacillaceae]|uniref:cell division protein ZapA n=1 Tax=Bacillaceae TaxID=186817 RepID=UPI001BDE7197|nr:MULTISPECIES: cell division protein ZapA [Bacillaceae]MDX8359352.1 cell division protein ZapA [Cytobacillus sp. IB215316]